MYKFGESYTTFTLDKTEHSTPRHDTSAVSSACVYTAITKAGPECAIYLLKLFLTFAVAFLLFSELTEKEVIAGPASLFMIQEEAIKKGYVAYFLVSDAYVPFDSIV